MEFPSHITKPLHGHLTSTHPTPKDPKAIKDAKQKAMNDWDHAEMLMWYMLSQCLPNLTAVCLKNVLTVAECWNKVKNKFSVKSQYAEVDLLTSFLDMQCSSTVEVQTFLAQM